MDWYLQVLKKYADFSGRARRKEYWMFQLFNIIISVVFTAIDMALGLNKNYGVGVFSIIYSLAVLIPSLAVQVRRLHDTNRSGWWILIGLICLVGPIILLVFDVQDSDPGENQYGPNPKALLA